jgi:flagellar hook-associated protein FlgK
MKWKGERMEQMAVIKYLGTIISVDGKIDTEINNRVKKVNQVYCQIKQ